jgi:hypothetical protein
VVSRKGLSLVQGLHPLGGRLRVDLGASRASFASLNSLEAEYMPCLSLLRRVHRSKQSMMRGLMMRRSYFSLSNLVPGEVR